MLRTHEIETTRTVLLLIAVVCSFAALYLIAAGMTGTSPVTNPVVADGSVPHAFPSAG